MPSPPRACPRQSAGTSPRVGLGRPGTLALPDPVLQLPTPEGLWPWTPDMGGRLLPRTGKPARATARRGRRGQDSGGPGAKNPQPPRGWQSCSQRSGDPTFASRFSPGSPRLQIAGRAGGAAGSYASRSLPGLSLAPNPGGAGQSLGRQWQGAGTATRRLDGRPRRKPPRIAGPEPPWPVPGPRAGSGFD